MLVLSRKPNEGIQLGDDIVITVVSIEGDRVRLGIHAPKSLHILRSELLAGKPVLSEGIAEKSDAAIRPLDG